MLAIIDRLTKQVALNQQTSSLNNSVTPDRPYLDLAYQLVGIGLGLVPVALALYLLGRVEPPAPYAASRFLGLDRRRPGFDLGGGVVLAAPAGDGATAAALDRIAAKMHLPTLRLDLQAQQTQFGGLEAFAARVNPGALPAQETP